MNMLATALQLAFIGKELGKGCDEIGFDKLEMFKTGFRAPIDDMLCIQAWIRVLKLASSVFILTLSSRLLRACF